MVALPRSWASSGATWWDDMALTQPFPGGLTSPQVWLDGILPKIPGAAVDTVKHEVLSVMRDFFAFSGAWRDWVGPILLHPLLTEYAIEVGDIKAEAVTTLVAHLSPMNLDMSQVRADMIGPLLGSQPVGEYPTIFYNPTPNTIVFLPIPQAEGNSVSLYVTMQPLDLAIPANLQGQHFDAICTGVLARLFLSKGIYTDMALGGYHAKRYNYLRTAARIAAEGNFDAPRRHATPAVPYTRPMSGLRVFGR